MRSRFPFDGKHAVEVHKVRAALPPFDGKHAAWIEEGEPGNFHVVLPY